MNIPTTLVRDAHRQRLEDAGVIKSQRPDPVMLFQRKPNTGDQKAGSLRLRLIGLTNLLTR